MRSNCTLEQQSLVVVRHIVTWVTFIIKREIRRRPNSTSRPQLWQDTKWQGATLEAWSVTLETWNELSKHWTIAASGGEYRAMQLLITSAKRGHISRDAINLTLSAYNDSCAEMRSEARVACIRLEMDSIQT